MLVVTDAMDQKQRHGRKSDILKNKEILHSSPSVLMFTSGHPAKWNPFSPEPIFTLAMDESRPPQQWYLPFFYVSSQ